MLTPTPNSTPYHRDGVLSSVSPPTQLTLYDAPVHSPQLDRLISTRSTSSSLLTSPKGHQRRSSTQTESASSRIYFENALHHTPPQGRVRVAATASPTRRDRRHGHGRGNRASPPVSRIERFYRVGTSTRSGQRRERHRARHREGSSSPRRHHPRRERRGRAAHDGATPAPGLLTSTTRPTSPRQRVISLTNL